MQLCLHVSRLAIWKLLDDMGQLMLELVVIYSNNISSIMMVNNPIYHTKANYIFEHSHFVREVESSRGMISTEAACLTKHEGD